MRIIAVAPGPNFSVKDVYDGWCHGLVEAGAQVARYNLDDRLQFYSNALIPVEGEEPKIAFDPLTAAQRAVDGLMSLVYQLQPDVVLIVSAFFVPADVMELFRARGTRVVVVHTEEPYELDRELGVAGHADLNVLNDPTHLERFQSLAPSYYQPHSYRPQIHHLATGPADPDHISDVVFAGTGYPSRVTFLEQVDWTGIDFALAGHWAKLPPESPLQKFVAHDIDLCLDNADVVKLYHGSKASFNLYRKETREGGSADGCALSPREVEMAACGLFFAREPRGEGDELLSMLPTFTDPGDLTDILRWYLARDWARSELADQARLAVADRTFVNAAKALLHRLDA